MFRVNVLIGILVGLGGLSAGAADSSYAIEIPTYEQETNSIKYMLIAKNCSGPAVVSGEPIAECNPDGGKIDVILSASCKAGNGEFRSPGNFFSLANDSLREAVKKCGDGNVFVRADDIEVPRSVGVSLDKIEKAFAAKENSKIKETIQKSVGSKIGNKGGASN